MATELATKFLTDAEARLAELQEKRRTQEAELQAEVQRREGELQPIVSEENDLTMEIARVKGETVTTNGNGAAAAPGTSVARRGRPPQEDGTRAADTLKMIADAGADGATVRFMQEKLGMANPNYLYRITAQLIADGKIKKVGKVFVLA